jgi:hypothetical protein
MKRRFRAPHSVLLDSNVWRYVADDDAGRELQRVAHAANVTIQIVPSVVYEALRTEDSVLRQKLIALMTDSHWLRLMPEAYHESLA